MGQKASYVFQEVLSQVSHLTKEGDVAAVQSRTFDEDRCRTLSRDYPVTMDVECARSMRKLCPV